MGITIRKADLSDASAIARVHVDSWKTAYREIVPDSYLANLSYNQRESGWKDAITSEESFIFGAESEISKK